MLTLGNVVGDRCAHRVGSVDLSAASYERNIVDWPDNTSDSTTAEMDDLKLVLMRMPFQSGEKAPEGQTMPRNSSSCIVDDSVAEMAFDGNS